ncbi:MAG: SHOCT domain-containing protein [Actinomycetota bacterium]
MSNRKEELLAAARERLAAEHAARDGGGSVSGSPEIRYRGQVLRGGANGTPGSGIGHGSPASAHGSNGAGGDIRSALQQIKDLQADGLISRAEAERKRSEILGRL